MKFLDLCILVLVGILALNHQAFSTFDGQISDDTSTQDDYYQDQSTSLVNNLGPEPDAAVDEYDYDLAETDDKLSEKESSPEPVDETTAQMVVADDEDVSVEDTSTESVQVFTVSADLGGDELLDETTQMSVLDDEELGSGDSSDIIRLGDDDITTSESSVTDEDLTTEVTTGTEWQETTGMLMFLL